MVAGILELYFRELLMPLLYERHRCRAPLLLVQLVYVKKIH